MAAGRNQLTINTATVAGTFVLTVSGVLDGTTYVLLRHAIKRAALDRPRAVIVDIAGLIVIGKAAWPVFPDARWYITEGPDVPMALVCDKAERRKALCRNGINRDVPPYWTLDAAIAELTGDSRRTSAKYC